MLIMALFSFCGLQVAPTESTMESLGQDLLASIIILVNACGLDFGRLRLINKAFRDAIGILEVRLAMRSSILEDQLIQMSRAYPNAIELHLNGAVNLTGASIDHVAAGFLRLRTLVLNRCSWVPEITASSLARLTYLDFLSIAECNTLVSWADSYSILTGLRTLSLRGCQGLVSLSNSISSLTLLQNLDLSDSPNLSSLPAGLCYLPALCVLDLSWYSADLKTCMNTARPNTTLLGLKQCTGVQSLVP